MNKATLSLAILGTIARQPLSVFAEDKPAALAMRGLRQAIRALDVPEAKIAALNWFPKNANW